MKHISDLRKNANLTQVELAEKLQLSQQAVSKYEKEERDPDIDVLIRIARFFNVSTDYLLGLSTSKQSYWHTVQADSFSLNEDIRNNLNYWISCSEYGYDEIAQMLGITKELLEDYCSGTIQPPLEILTALSEICQVSTDCLLGIIEENRPADSNGKIPFRFDPEIAHRLKTLASKQNYSYSLLANILGITEQEVHNFFEYGFVPHISILTKILEEFLVSADYILNRSRSAMTIHQSEERLLKAYRSLSEDSKIIALSELLKLQREESLVAAKEQQIVTQGKSYPSSGTEG